MPCFEGLFIEAKSANIKYKDLELTMMDRIPVPKKFSGTIRLISTNSEWKQAACLDVYKYGQLELDCEKKKGLCVMGRLFTR